MKHSSHKEDSYCLRKTLSFLIDIGEEIMSKISDFAAKQTEFNTQMDESLKGLSDDIKALNDKILELQNSPGAITPEDQQLLDNLQAQGQSLADKLKAMDALYPPVVPVA